MIEEFIENKITEHFGFEPTSEQQILIKKLSLFLVQPDYANLFLLKGFAGTGKTSVVSALVKTFEELKQPVMLMAPTGRAAKVLSAYSAKSAFTIHRIIYRQKTSDAGSRFDLAFNNSKDCLFIVDEASMVANMGDNTFGSGRLLDDLITYVYGGNNCRLLLLGDTAQLPPVMQTESKALDKSELESYGLKIAEFTLKQVVRQAEKSGILSNATLIRNIIENENSPQSLCLQPAVDVIKSSSENFTEMLDACYRNAGLEETIVVTRSNKRASMYIEGIRNRVLYREEKVSTGDLLMVVRNNYAFGKEYEGLDFIANGEIAEVVRVRGCTELYDCSFLDVTLRFIDYDWEVDGKILLDSLYCPNAADLQELNKKLFASVEEDYMDISNKRDRYKKMRNDIYLNALQVKFSYAITCHKAQGGQWENVFVDMGMIKKEDIDVPFLRWLYTAVTRATQKLYLVNFSDDFFC